MNLKKLMALLLALVMIFALAACSSTDSKGSDKDSEKTEESKDAEKGEDSKDSKKAAEYDALLSAVEKVYNDKNADGMDMVKAAFGKEVYDLMQPLYDAMVEMGETDESEVADVNILDLEGYEKGDKVEFEVTSAEALDDAAISELKAQAKAGAESMQTVAAFADIFDEMSEEELAENGMTPEDVQQFKDMVAAMLSIGDYLADCEIDSGYALKLNVKINGETQEIEKTVAKVNGEWVFADLFEAMNEMGS